MVTLTVIRVSGPTGPECGFIVAMMSGDKQTGGVRMPVGDGLRESLDQMQDVTPSEKEQQLMIEVL